MPNGLVFENRQVTPKKQKAARRRDDGDPPDLLCVCEGWRHEISTCCRYDVTAPDRCRYPSAMAAFHAQKLRYLKSGPPAEVERLRGRLQHAGASEAERLGQKGSFKSRSLILDVDRWRAARDQEMRAILTARTKTDRRFRQILLATKPYALHNLDRRDVYWGCRSSDGVLWEGENKLGAILAEVRGTLAEEPPQETREFAGRETEPRGRAPGTHGIRSAFTALMREIDKTPHVLVCQPGESLHYAGKDGQGNRGWHLPGGRVDPGEVGALEDTAMREFEEEIGVPLPEHREAPREYTLEDVKNPRNNIRLYEVWLDKAWEAPSSSEEMRAIVWIPLRALVEGGKTVRPIAQRLAGKFLRRHLS